MKKKILSGLLIGAFVFGLGTADIQPVSAAMSNEIKESKDKFDRNGDNSNRPEPPKDKDGNPLPPPDRNNGDNSDRPEPPKDKDGNPLPPPDRNNGDNSDRPEPPKDKDGNLLPPPDRNNGDNSDRPIPPNKN